MKLEDLVKTSVSNMHIIHLDENGDRVIRFYAEPQFLSDGTVDHFYNDLPYECRNDWNVYLQYDVEKVNASENELIVFIKPQEV